MAENLTWQQVRDGARERDPVALVAQLQSWFELMPLWQWASLAHAELKAAIEAHAKSIEKPFTVDQAIRALGEVGEARALHAWLAEQSFAGAGRLRVAVEAHLEVAVSAPAAPAVAREEPTPPAREEPKAKEEPKPPAKEEPKPKEEARAKEEPKPPAKEEPKPKEEAKAKDDAKAKDEAKAKEEPKPEAKKDERKP